MDSKLFQDAITVLNIFPKIKLEDLYRDLLNIAHESNRVHILLKRYLSLPPQTSCDLYDNNRLGDVKKIRKVFPNYCIAKIIRDIKQFRNDRNRVHRILNMYFEDQNFAELMLENDGQLIDVSKKAKFNSENTELNTNNDPETRNTVNDAGNILQQEFRALYQKLNISKIVEVDRADPVFDKICNNNNDEIVSDASKYTEYSPTVTENEERLNLGSSEINHDPEFVDIKSFGSNIAENALSFNEEQLSPEMNAKGNFDPICSTNEEQSDPDTSSEENYNFFFPLGEDKLGSKKSSATDNKIKNNSKLSVRNDLLARPVTSTSNNNLCMDQQISGVDTVGEEPNTVVSASDHNLENDAISKRKRKHLPDETVEIFPDCVFSFESMPSTSKNYFEIPETIQLDHSLSNDECALVSVNSDNDPLRRKRNEIYQKMLNSNFPEVPKRQKRLSTATSSTNDPLMIFGRYNNRISANHHSPYHTNYEMTPYFYERNEPYNQEMEISNSSSHESDVDNTKKEDIELHSKEGVSQFNINASNSECRISACAADIYGPSSSKKYPDHPFVNKLLQLFPDACPHFVRGKCQGLDETDDNFENLMTFMLEGKYAHRQREPSPPLVLDFETQYKLLLDVFPDADPTFLQQECERLIESANDFQQFVNTNLELKNYPLKEDYEKKLKLSTQQKQYTSEFNVKNYLDVIPNPEEFFHNPNRIPALCLSTAKETDVEYAKIFLNNHYRTIHSREIQTMLHKCEKNLIEAANKLDRSKKTLRTKRKLYPLTTCSNIPLLQEIAYLTHKKEISGYIEKQKEAKAAEQRKAKELGLLKTCDCCFDDELMPHDTAFCTEEHMFCKDCIRKNCEILYGQGRLTFPCLKMCDGEFSLLVLQAVLTPKMFSKIAQRKQLEEIKAAGIEDLESCPFCDFATIPAPNDKIFRCLNSDCMKESCRQCKEASHIPLRCEEVEKEQDIKMRTYIENKMTEALVRVCYKCGMKFVKEDGCNKMTCHCGAVMCYVCNKPVKDYKHFNGQGGDRHHLCPLYNDTVKLHMTDVQRGAQEAKKELGLESNEQLKIDPTKNLENHFRTARRAYGMRQDERINHNDFFYGPIDQYYGDIFNYPMFVGLQPRINVQLANQVGRHRRRNQAANARPAANRNPPNANDNEQNPVQYDADNDDIPIILPNNDLL